MDFLLEKITQQATNHAIRTGIAITSGFVIQQCSRLLKNVEGGTDKSQLANLQLKLESKIRIISPAIDMIELIAARGNTTLESAVTLTKALRWDIQALGIRLQKAAAEEELTRRGISKARNAEQNSLELKLIISETKQLLERIEDAVPLINLAITTSGVNLSTTLPDTISPSRLLQASTLLTSGDAQYAMDPSRPRQICPDFTVSMYMLFSGHASRPQDEEGIRETTWKEVIHKARMRILRVPLHGIYDYPSGPDDAWRRTSFGTDDTTLRDFPSEGTAYEYAYQMLLIEDLDDGRVHTFDDEGLQPSPYEGIERAGLRELIPIHEISKIFYADTGKILNIGTEGEPNNPILLLKRDVNAVPPRRMMPHPDSTDEERDKEQDASDANAMPSSSSTLDEQSKLDEQIFRESPSRERHDALPHPTSSVSSQEVWRLPSGLDPEWVAFEVYVDDASDDSDVDDSEVDADSSSATASPSQRQSSRSPSLEPSLTSAFSRFGLRSFSSTPTSRNATPSKETAHTQVVLSPQKRFTEPPHTTNTLTLPAMRTSLSLLEMLIRLTALQQFQQTSHLAIPDELLNFFLSESATVGAGGDAALRQRVRRDARRRVGFDPYDESPIKRRGEEYLAHNSERHNDDEQWERSSAYRGSRGSQSPHAQRSSIGASSFSQRLQQHHYSMPSSPSPTYPLSSPDTSSADVPLPNREFPSPHDRASPSPLLRRVTAPNVVSHKNSAGLAAATRRAAKFHTHHENEEDHD